MILEGLALIGAAVGVAVIGAPIASSLAQPHTFRRKASRDNTTNKQRVELARAFQPLDLGPDPVKWPSERPWELASALPDADWPSKAWKDDHFGRHWRDGSVKEIDDRGFHAMASRHLGDSGAMVPPRPAAPHAHTPRERKAAREEAARAQTPKLPPAKSSSNQQRKQRGEGNRANQEAARRQQKVALEQARNEAQSKRSPPDVAEIEHLVSTVGLAETVKTIMQRTGWDFREAAQYLAKVRQGG